MKSVRQRRAYSLVELIVAIGICAILIAILVPVFASVRGDSKGTACITNLSQIGRAILIYAADYDEQLPSALDCNDKYNLQHGLAVFPGELTNQQLAGIPTIKTALAAYNVADSQWSCPLDHLTPPVSAWPAGFTSFYQLYGASYTYSDEMAVVQKITLSGMGEPSAILLSWDISDSFHNGFRNAVFADGHAAKLSADDQVTVITALGQ